MPAAQQVEALKELLRIEHGLLTQLAELLAQEFAAARTQEDLTDILAQKPALITALDEATERRLDWLDAAALPLSGDTLKEAMTALDPTDDLGRLYTAFERDAVACRERNRQLGQIHLRRQQSVQKALHIFANRAEADDSDYTAQGESIPQQTTRLLGSA
jgi:flagellar biosynthesis/type III secretory pathway chaperone